MIQSLIAIVGAAHVSTDRDVLAARSVDWTGRYRGQAGALVRPGSAEQVAAVLAACREAGAYVTVQGGRTSLVAGTVPEHDDVLLSTERLTALSEVDPVRRRIRAGAGVPLSGVQHAATAAGLLMGVDLASRDSATVGGMAATNAGGLRTVRYGPMRDQVDGIEVALADGSVLRRHSAVRSDNTGYDLASLMIGSEGTLGVITEVDIRLHPIPPHHTAALCGFADLDALIAAGVALREVETVTALELVDGRAAELAAEHLDVAVPVRADWLLLVELAGDTEQTGRLAVALEGLRLCADPAVGVDAPARQRLWAVRESLTEVTALFGAPLKFDVALAHPAIPGFVRDAAALIARHAPDALPIVFGHIGEGNLHLNVLRCTAEQERALYTPMMELIGAHGGNVSSEHGVGTLKRAYLSMSRTPSDIAAMRAIKAAFDPDGYLNAAVLFD